MATQSNQSDPKPDQLVKLTLVPVQVFAAGLCGNNCENCETHQGYGLMDAVSAWSDCNRAVGKIYRVDDVGLSKYRNTGDTVTIQVKREDVAWFDKQFDEEDTTEAQNKHLESYIRQREAEARIDELELLNKTEDLHASALTLILHVEEGCPMVEGINGYVADRLAQLKQEQK